MSRAVTFQQAAILTHASFQVQFDLPLFALTGAPAEGDLPDILRVATVAHASLSCQT